MSLGAVLVAAGKGERAGAAQPKQFELVGGRPMLDWSLDALEDAAERTVVVLPAGSAAGPHLAERGFETAVGGATRTASVRAGLEALATGAAPSKVLIHDAARPGLTKSMIAELGMALDVVAGAAPALPLADAVKRVSGDRRVIEDAPRDGLFRVQTPQAFRFGDILAAYRALPAGASLEDDIAVARRAGLDVRLIPGDARLAKVTQPEDFDTVAKLIAPNAGVPLIGSGVDAHRFGPGDHVMLCGVRVPHDHGLIGHSDSDAGWHALTDAILGAVSAGDIGHHFSPSDPRWKGASSAIFLSRALEIAAEAGARVVNADITIICETPRIGPHREAMRASTANLLGVPVNRISVKGTTTEGMGFTGRREGLAAQASVLLLGR